jgi:DNA-binding CsgD family transcriptional regulator
MHTPTHPSTHKTGSLTYQQGYVGLKRPALGGHHADVLASALDEIACGVMILNSQGQLQHCNLAARVLLDRSQCLQDDQGQINAVESKDTQALKDALYKALAGKRSMLNLGAEAQTSVAVVPLDRHAEPDPSHEPRIALIFSRTGMCEALMMSFFSRAYQLTRAEEQILGMLCVGHTAPEMAKQLRVGEATVRTHIRNICTKTHSNGIREVVKRLALLPPLMAAVMPSAFV